MTRLTLLAVSSLIALGAGEAAMRVHAHSKNQDTLAAAFRRPVNLVPGSDASLGQIIRPSSDDRIAYELTPGLAGILFKGRPLSTSSQGFRGPEIEPLAPAKGVTIVGIGDSIMFGHGVGDGEGYLEQLAAMLRHKHSEVRWRVVNSAVPGYNTVAEVATLEVKCLALNPDLVVLGLCGNDYAPPQYVRIEDDVLDPRRSFLLEGARRLLFPEPDLAEAPALTHRPSWAGEQGDSGKAPDRYAHLVGKAPFLKALDRLVELSERHGFAVLVVATVDFGPIPEMLAACTERGLPTLLMQQELEATYERITGKAFTWEGYGRSPLVASHRNGHPSVRQHRMIAARLYRTLEQAGLPARWLAAR